MSAIPSVVSMPTVIVACLCIVAILAAIPYVFDSFFRKDAVLNDLEQQAYRRILLRSKTRSHVSKSDFGPKFDKALNDGFVDIWRKPEGNQHSI